MTEEQLLQIRENIKQGPFEAWKHQCAVSDKLKFILDHCNPEEQKLYLKEFTTEDLGKFLMKEVASISDADCEKLAKMDVRNHVLPGINTLYNLKFRLKASLALSKDLTEREKVTRVIKMLLQEKIKEVQWRKIDSEIANH